MNAKMRQHAGFVALVVGLCLLTWVVWPSERSGPRPARGAGEATAKPAPARAEPAPHKAPAPVAVEPSPAAAEPAAAAADFDAELRSAVSEGSPAPAGQTGSGDMDEEVRSMTQFDSAVEPPDKAEKARETAPAPAAPTEPEPKPAASKEPATATAAPSRPEAAATGDSATPAPSAAVGPAANTGADIVWPKLVALDKGVAMEKLSAGLSMAFKGDGSLDTDKASKYVESRRSISAAYNAGSLTEAEQEKARAALTTLADATIFSRWVYEGDDLVKKYKFQSGDWLDGTRKIGGKEQHGLIRKMSLRVPARVILTANRVPGGKDFRAGETYKLIQGPFHCIITKKQFTLDMYLQDTFVKRYRVAVGAPETPTPVGYFHVVLNGKMIGAPYNPPPNRGTKHMTLHPGDKDYPLDREGHNIRIEGVPAKGTNISAEEGFAVHGTNDPTSIGKSISLGCVRLAPADIKEVYGMLYEKWSTVEIRP